ncbi:L-lysine 6-monooxygenase (NADPH-requiring)-domain-containing protein [Phellopilus nigrolimitatus]|nr:L-lysine 6-monooxygenase (NADPH-requiring)-domain-containing protein [Phellopilus nigrolimitatus]
MSAPPAAPSPQSVPFDVLGCGFGPANLAIAVALVDKSAADQGKPIQRAIFVEKHPEFQWHPGMLLPGTRMQISAELAPSIRPSLRPSVFSCLKDLATLRNPSSPFTFLAYLHAQHRLAAFINRGSTVPTRREFADYLAWAAREVARRGVQVAYAEEVVAICKIAIDARQLIDVTSRRVHTGELVSRRTKHLILSAGGSPRLPRMLAALQPSPWAPESALRVPVLHTASYMTAVRPLLTLLARGGAPLKIAFIGAGQSATECLLDMHGRLAALGTAGHQIDMIMRKGSLKPSDDSPFVNEIFDPSTTDEWYNLPSDRLRGSILSEYKNTNYSVVNPVTLDAMYELIYDQKLSDSIAARDTPAPGALDVRVSLRAYENVIGASTVPTASPDGPQRIALTRQHVHTHELIEDTYDAVICGTGYERTAWLRLLRASNLAKDFGLSDAPAKLVPAHYPVAPEAELEREDGAEILLAADEHEHSSTESMSSPSTPPSSPSLSLSPHAVPAPTQVRISRAYRLLPRCERSSPSSEPARKGENRVYLQGCAEATHGLSDTLLSVLGVRAGEVVDDLWAARD